MDKSRNFTIQGEFIMSGSTFAPKIQFFAYRLATIAKSFKTLYTLPPEKVSAFLNSYDMYDHDWANEEELIQNMGPEYYTKIKQKLVDYYGVLNHLCALGQVEKMYIPPAMDLSKSIIANQTLFEERMGKDLKVKEKDRLLDIGCGRGRVASHIASLTGAHITGINIDPGQIACAKRFAQGKSLTDRCHFQVGDLNELPFPFPDNSLDGIYQIQVFSYAKDFDKLFAELYRMLKPGKRFACLDWFALKNYDPQNAAHVELIKRIKPLIGAIGTVSVETFVGALQKAGFKILTNENASIDGLQSPLIENADRFFTRAKKTIKMLVKCKLLPAHFNTLFDRLTKDGEAFVEADRMRLVTTSHYIVAQKPK